MRAVSYFVNTGIYFYGLCGSFFSHLFELNNNTVPLK